MDSLPPLWRLRIYFSKTSGTWRLEQDDGSELEYDETKGTWIPLVRSKFPFPEGYPLIRTQIDDLISRQQAAYAVEGVDENVGQDPPMSDSYSHFVGTCRTRPSTREEETQSRRLHVCPPSLQREPLQAQKDRYLGTKIQKHSRVCDGSPP